MALTKESEQCRDGPCLCESKQNQKDKFEHEVTSIVSYEWERSPAAIVFLFSNFSLI